MGNNTRIEINLIEVFRTLFWSVLVKKFISKTLLALSISATGPLGVILTKIIEKFADKTFEWVATEIKMESIVLNNEIHQKIWERSQLRLKIIARTHGIESEEFKKERKEQHEKLIDAIVYNTDPTVLRFP